MQPYILSIETSTEVCSVAVSCGAEVLFEKVNFEGPSHAALLGVFVEEALTFLKSAGRRPDAVAVSAGPGSYTGLRIGVSEAKGLCYGLDIPLIAVDTLCLMAALAADRTPTGAVLCPMIDARRMEVYAGVYTRDLEVVRNVAADIVDENSYTEFLSHGKVCFFGNGAAKCKDKLTHPNAVFLEGIYPLASSMAPMAADAYTRGYFTDTAYYEPFYLKEFVATTPKNKVLGG